MFKFWRGRSCVIDGVSPTAWRLRTHLHGFASRVRSRNGAPTPYRERDRIEVAPAKRGTDHLPEYFADRIAGTTVRRDGERDACERRHRGQTE